jgi:hypothetical protein
MEHLFYSEATSANFNIKNDSAKMEFTQEVIPLLGNEHFEIFRPMFEDFTCGLFLMKNRYLKQVYFSNHLKKCINR